MTPNIIVFLLDMLRPDRLRSCGGQAAGSTFIDEVLSQSTLFPNTFASGPYTLIALNSWFTGFYGATSGVDGYFKSTPDDLHEQVITVTDILKAHGYSTLYFSEYGLRSCVPTFSFDLLKNDEAIGQHTIDAYNRAPEPRFAFLHFESLHNNCCTDSSVMTPERYDREVAKLARQFERIYRATVKEGDVVVVFSDHGVRIREPFDNKLTPRSWPEERSGIFVTDKTIRTFTSLSQHGTTDLLRPRVVDSVVRAFDIAPTILDMLGMPPLGAQGMSLWPYLQPGASAKEAFPALTAYFRNRRAPVLALVAGRTGGPHARVEVRRTRKVGRGAVSHAGTARRRSGEPAR